MVFLNIFKFEGDPIYPMFQILLYMTLHPTELSGITLHDAPPYRINNVKSVSHLVTLSVEHSISSPLRMEGEIEMLPPPTRAAHLAQVDGALNRLHVSRDRARWENKVSHGGTGHPVASRWPDLRGYSDHGASVEGV